MAEVLYSLRLVRWGPICGCFERFWLSRQYVQLVLMRFLNLLAVGGMKGLWSVCRLLLKVRITNGWSTG